MTTLNLVLVAVFVTCLGVTSASYCDPPEAPKNGYFTPKRSFYSIGKRVEFFCNKGFYLVGKSYTICTYDRKTGKTGFAHPTPICKPKQCPYLSAPAYGSVKLSGRYPGDTATYSCDPGFRLEGESTRECGPKGEWGGKEPTCVLITCPDLEDPQYGFVELTGNRVGDKATYHCDYGFVLNGDSQRECQYSGDWSGQAATCVPITCPNLNNPQYGSVELSGNRVGDRADYECDFGFYLSGDSQRVCLSSGDWSGEAPTCVAITCLDLEAPKYGSVDQSGNRVGDEANYTCDSGFELDGDSPRECQESGEWSGDAPACVPILCPDLEDPAYGSVETTDNRVGDVANYECNFGFRLEGDSQRTCMLSGEWSSQAPTCVAITCPDLDDPTYGSVDVTGNRVGYEANYECNFGFRLVGNRQRICQESGEWGGEAPTCVAILCPDLEDPQYGSVVQTGNRVGDTANYTCSSGFTLVGDNPRECQESGDWSGEAPACVPILCPDLEDPAYGSVETTDNRVGDVANYVCNFGFRLEGDSQRTCLLSGEWSSQAPTCVAITCPDLDDPKYGSVKLTGNRVGDEANYRCNLGFRVSGDDQRECLASGDWSGEAPTCVAITCPDLEDPRYGSVELTGNKVGDYANYRCDFGFRLEGASQRKCLVSGEWSLEVPTCVRIRCPDLDDPDYGLVVLTGNKVGDYANYKCDIGFRLVGEAQRKCLESGAWSGEAPVCKRIVCPNLSKPEYGFVKMTDNTPGSSAHYDCERGFKLVGDRWRKCLDTGKWTGADPSCRSLQNCGKPPSPKFGYVKFSSTYEGSSAYYFCSKGYVLHGSSLRVCQSDGYWSGSVPSCVRSYYHRPHGRH